MEYTFKTEVSWSSRYTFLKINAISVVLLTPYMTLRNGDTIELIWFVTHIKYQIIWKRTFPGLSKATWPVVLAMEIVIMVTYIYEYYGKSVVQVLSPRGKVWVWDSGLGLHLAAILVGVHYQISLFNNAWRVLFNNVIKQWALIMRGW